MSIITIIPNIIAKGPPQYAVAPGGSTTFLRGVPVVGAGIILVCGLEGDTTFVIGVEAFLRLSALIQLIVLVQIIVFLLFHELR